MALGNLYKLRHQYNYFGENCENVYFYEQTLGNGGAIALEAAFVLDMETEVMSVLSEESEGQQIVIVNLDDSLDFGTFPTAVDGARTGPGLPAFNAWGFTYFSTDRNIRSGGKRLAGISESDTDSGQSIPAMTTLLDALALVMAAPIENAGAGNIFAPRLHTPGNLKTGGDPLTVALLGVSYRRMTTQSTRKGF